MAGLGEACSHIAALLFSIDAMASFHPHYLTFTPQTYHHPVHRFRSWPMQTTSQSHPHTHHIHTSIVSRHLATRGNNKILRTPPPHTSSSEERLPRLTRRTLAQFRTNKSPFLKSYLHKVDAKTHPSPLCPLCNIHTHDTHHLFNCTHIRTTLSPLDLWTDPAGVTALLARWTEKLAGGQQAGISDSPH